MNLRVRLELPGGTVPGTSTHEMEYGDGHDVGDAPDSPNSADIEAAIAAAEDDYVRRPGGRQQQRRRITLQDEDENDENDDDGEDAAGNRVGPAPETGTAMNHPAAHAQPLAAEQQDVHAHARVPVAMDVEVLEEPEEDAEDEEEEPVVDVSDEDADAGGRDSDDMDESGDAERDVGGDGRDGGSRMRPLRPPQVSSQRSYRTEAANAFGPDATNGSIDTTSMAHEQARRREAALRLEAAQAGGSSASDAGGDDMDVGAGVGAGPRGAPAQSMYDGYDAKLLYPGASRDTPFQPFMPASSSFAWEDVSGGLAPGDCRPVRSMCVNVLADFFRMDAKSYHEMQKPKDAPVRATQTAVIMGALFNGMQSGYVTGNLERAMRGAPPNASDGGQSGSSGRSREVEQLDRKERYAWAPDHQREESWPCYQIGHEELYDEDEDILVGVRIWLHVFDPAFSVSELVLALMSFEGAVCEAMSIGAGKGPTGKLRAAAETARRRQGSGVAAADIADNVEQHAAQQTQHLRTETDWRVALEIYSGRTAEGDGCPVHPDLKRLMDCAAARRQWVPDPMREKGSEHPLAPEFLLNSKRPDALRAGLAHPISGTPIAVSARQLDPASYFDQNDNLRVPNVASGRSFYWIWCGADERACWQLPLPRQLQGTVTPGPHLVDAFLQRRFSEAKRKALGSGIQEDSDEFPKADDYLTPTDRTMVQFRSLALEEDEVRSDDQRRARASLFQYDIALRQQHGHNLAAGANDVINGDDNGFEIEVTPVTDTLAEQGARLHRKLFESHERRRDEACAEAEASVPPWEDADGSEAVALSRAVLHKWQQKGYELRADSFKYFARLMDNGFRSTKDRLTLPRGYLAMHDALWQQVAKHGGSASIAFNGQGGAGKQLIAKDRTVWGSLQEWLGTIFVGDCMIDGRDRRIMASHHPCPCPCRHPYPCPCPHLCSLLAGRAVPTLLRDVHGRLHIHSRHLF